ncbi:MAG TPA: biotin--[acetyl-CoA-carboxylase] ligase [Candidatus Binatia bacterium]|nr:biotin--[acetyl-CoA-carboxylase] ligase [Candidatus Binatia bacterium]
MTREPDSPGADERIVAWLRAAGGPISGEELARRLGCSRAAVWKRIATLRRRGYRIEGRRAGGYALAAVPDRLGPAELAPYLRGAWRRVHWHEEVDSTQRVARELADAGAPEGTTVIAERQTAGRGRLGRVWHSPPGLNLYCSILLRPPLPPHAVPQVALVAGTAVAAAVAAQSTATPAIKWPNDVLVGGRKVAGILVEMDSEMERVRHVLVGIGVNLNAPAAAFPRQLRAKATSLLVATGRRVDRAAFAGRLLAELEARYGRYLSGGFASVRTEWESWSCLGGRDVCVAGPEGEVSGRVLGLDDDGALRLAAPDGGVVRIVAGEVTVRDGYRS